MNELTKEHLDEQFEKMAQMIGKGFAGVDQKFDIVDQRFNAVDQRLNTIDERLNIVETKLDRALYTESFIWKRACAK